ncbi:CGNR zinc finger domain-containing protein [Actinoplanes sp. NPDC023714]|uniref:CGNR zinc finger domain-containing protein n=1 Tax=Actinoplanes sp. NPDC023714 TaxID=3154322 RepID=UPI0033E1D9B1
MDVHADPRPLVGEPLPLDLVNTRWTGDDGPHDLLELPGGLAIWLSSAGLAAAAPGTLDALLATREALTELLQPSPSDPERARELLNATLRHGRIRRLLGEDGPEDVVETDTPGWLAAWTAADHYLRLLAENPARIRKCANPVCTLRFYDVSKAGARRWCSMATCGNRAKSRSHYARNHAAR